MPLKRVSFYFFFFFYHEVIRQASWFNTHIKTRVLGKTHTRLSYGDVLCEPIMCVSFVPGFGTCKLQRSIFSCCCCFYKTEDVLVFLLFFFARSDVLRTIVRKETASRRDQMRTWTHSPCFSIGETWTQRAQNEDLMQIAAILQRLIFWRALHKKYVF